MSDVFITENFLLQSRAAVRLYHEYAKDMPIIDYHTHLPPQQVADDQHFENLTQVWLYDDHYKWRAMRANGIPERYVTGYRRGEATDWEIFEKWAETVPRTLRNPLYHWVHLELKRPFGISDRLLNPHTAKSIWEECNAKLKQPEFSACGILKQMQVVLVCTIDDPVDTLEYHKIVAEDPSFEVQMLPAWRPDRALAVENPENFNDWVEKLAAAADMDIPDFGAFLEALQKRHDFFHAAGCRLSDVGMDAPCADDYTDAEVGAAFWKVRAGKTLSVEEIRRFKSAMLYELGLMDHAKGWVRQFHLGVFRNLNTRLFKQIGPDTGFDSMCDPEMARPLVRMLDRLDREDRLAKTILYNLNPRDNELFASMTGNFQDGSIPGKIQLGAAWWFMDQKNGMERQIEALSNLGLLSRFVGMLTDSRSFLSYTRHEYFRRVLCNILGNDIEQGLLPSDFDLVGGLVRDVCYHNAATFFGFDL